MLTPKEKNNIIKKFQTHKDDTGSPEVQVAILTKEIEQEKAFLSSKLRQIATASLEACEVEERYAGFKYTREIEGWNAAISEQKRKGEEFLKHP